MSEPTTERETCADCGDPSCKAESLGPYKTIERMQCYERTVANLRAALAEATKLREAAWDAGHQAGCQLALSSENDDGFGYENYGKHTNPYRKSVKRG